MYPRVARVFLRQITQIVGRAPVQARVSVQGDDPSIIHRSRQDAVHQCVDRIAPHKKNLDFVAGGLRRFNAAHAGTSIRQVAVINELAVG